METVAAPTRHSPILGPDGSPIARQRRKRDFNAYVDVSHTTNQDAEHWAFASSGDANRVYDYHRRRTARLRARYETTNNAVLRGFVDLRTEDTIQNGPTLQMREDEHEEIQDAFTSWSEEVCLAEKLTTAWDAKQVDGEGFALLVLDGSLDSEVPLNLLNFESEQCGNPFATADHFNLYDGVSHQNTMQRQYYVYDHHPDTQHRFNPMPYVGQWYPSSRVIHLYKTRRSGQLRGLCELVPALPLAAIHRRYTSATLGAAEEAASMAFWLETDSAPDDPNKENFEEFEAVPFVRNQLMSAPYGWKIHQTKGDQPTTGYELFDRAITIQMGRVLRFPSALSTDSAEHNMASGRLEFQTYIRSIRTDRKVYLEQKALSKIFMMWMQFYLGSRSGIAPSDVDTAFIRREYPHRWSWRPIQHSDPEKMASATVKLSEAGLLADEEYLHEMDIRPRDHYEALNRQNTIRRKLGMPIPGVQPGMQGLNGGTNGSQQNGQTEESETTTEDGDADASAYWSATY